MSKIVTALVVVASLISVMSTNSAFAQSDKKMAGNSLINVNKDGYALQENDPVDLVNNQKAMKGDRKFTATHGGAKYVFSSAENMKTFEAKPEEYTPAYGGYCAYGVGVGGLYDVDLSTAVVVEGRLMLNKNPNIAKTFAKDLKGNVAKADKVWPTLKK